MIGNILFDIGLFDFSFLSFVYLVLVVFNHFVGVLQLFTDHVFFYLGQTNAVLGSLSRRNRQGLLNFYYLVLQLHVALLQFPHPQIPTSTEFYLE